MEKITVGMSGGVDSSVTAALLKEQGYDVLGATLSLYKGSEECMALNLKNIKDAKDVCGILNIEHIVCDFEDRFKTEVIDKFISEYEAGRTPNPCILCNRRLKFAALLDEAEKFGSTKIATGHYAKILKDPVTSRYYISGADDESKDQTYVLYSLTQKQLSKTVMPLGELSKSEVRKIALKYGFANAGRNDSQDICFIPDKDYVSFIRRYTGKSYPGGNFVNKDGTVLGKHNGIISYTVGQRKGLGIALGKPAFVISKNAENGDIVLGNNADLFSKFVKVRNLNFLPFEQLKGKMGVTAKIRYNQSARKATIEMVDEDTLLIEFETPQRAAASGQSAVFYDGNAVIGGGIII